MQSVEGNTVNTEEMFEDVDDDDAGEADDDVSWLVEDLQCIAEGSSMESAVAGLTPCQVSFLLELMHWPSVPDVTSERQDDDVAQSTRRLLLKLLTDANRKHAVDCRDEPVAQCDEDLVDGVFASSSDTASDAQSDECFSSVNDVPVDMLRKLGAFAHIDFSAMLSRYVGVKKLAFGKWKKRRKLDDDGVFGIPLTTLLVDDKHRCRSASLASVTPSTTSSESDSEASGRPTVPLVFQQMVEYVRENGLDQEGILRVEGKTSSIKHLRQRINHDRCLFARQSSDVQRSDSKSTLDSDEQQGQEMDEFRFTVHDVASVLKQFIRELPTPLLSLKGEYCKAAINPITAFARANALRDESDKLKAFNLLTIMLPEVNRHVLRMLLRLLGDIVARETVNNMCASNVAIVMAPSLFLTSFDARADDKAAKERIRLENDTAKDCIVYMIEKQDQLFKVPANLCRQLRSMMDDQSGKSVADNVAAELEKARLYKPD